MLEFPLYDLIINEDDQTGWYFLSLVDKPAIKLNWLAFSEEEKQNFQFKITNEDKRILSGPFFVPDLPIHKRLKNGKDVYVKMTAENIEKMTKKFFKNKFTSNIDSQHTRQTIDNVYIIESWFTSKMDKSKEMGYDLPDRTLFGSVFIEDEEYWNKLKSEDKLKGFSIDGIFDMQLVAAFSSEVDSCEDEKVNQIKELILKNI